MHDSNSFPPFQINGDKIDSTGNINYLGVQIDPSLNWKEKINVTIGTISRGTGMPKYSKIYVLLQTIQRMYFGVADSHLVIAAPSGSSCRDKQFIRPYIVAINIKTRVVNS